MSTMFKNTKHSFHHGLGCEMIKLEIISLKEIRRLMVRDYRIEKNALKSVMRCMARGEDTSNVNLKLFGISNMGYVTQIKKLEFQIALLKDNYHNLYGAVYTKVTGEEHNGGASRHVDKFCRSNKYPFGLNVENGGYCG